MDSLIRILESISLVRPDEGFSFVRLAPIPRKDKSDSYWESYLSMVAGIEKLVTDLEEKSLCSVYGSERDRARLYNAMAGAVVGIRYLAWTYRDVKDRSMDHLLDRYLELI